MNSALFHAARPGDIRSAGGRAGGLKGGGGQACAGMREAAAVAKEMGFGEDFGPQAANMWKMLDDLAVTDSAAYAEMAKAGAEALRKPKGKVFTPTAGFVVKASLEHPWAPPLNSSNTDGGSRSENARKVVENVAAGTKVFVNLCCHDGVPPPVDQADREVDVTTEGRNASGLRIPMFVSPVRETTDHSDDRALAVDVVFHPWVLRCSKGEHFFRDQVVALAMGWITREHPGLVVSRRRKLLKLCAYKGGGGRKGGTPVPFPADDASVQAQSLNERESKSGPKAADGSGGDDKAGLLDDPKSLLAAMKGSVAGDDQGAAGGGLTARQGGDQNSGSASLASTTVGESQQRKTGGGETSAELRLNSSGAGRTNDIFLPGALAGLKADGGKRAGTGRVEGRHGPLISITPAAATPSPDGRGEDRHETEVEARGAEEVKAGSGARCQGQGARRRGDRKGSPVVKKGFLSASQRVGGRGGGRRAPLYPPSGSENGAEPSAYVKLMSRCKVVDTSNLSKEEMDAAMKAHAGGGVTPHPTTTKPPTSPSETASSPTSAGGRIGGRQPTSAAVKKGFLDSGAGGGCLYGKEGSREGGSVRGGSGRTSRADRKFEQLVALADPDMGDVGDGASKTSHGTADDPMTEQLAQLAKILGPTTPFLEPVADARPAAAGVSSSSSGTMPLQSGKAAGVGTRGKPSSPSEGKNAAAKTLDLQGHSPLQGRADGADDTCASADDTGIRQVERTKPATVTDTATRSGTTQAAAAAGATDVGKRSTSSTSMTPETLQQAMPAPTSTITGDKSADGAKKCGNKTPPSKEALSSASTDLATAEQNEREPIYRIEQLHSSTDAAGIATKQKRKFAVIIDLPELVEGLGDGQNHEVAKPQQQGGARDGASVKKESTRRSSNGGTGGRTGPSLSDVELDVSPAALQLRVSGKYLLRLELPCIVDEDIVTAKFNKSRAVLRVLVQEK